MSDRQQMGALDLLPWEDSSFFNIQFVNKTSKWLKEVKNVTH